MQNRIITSISLLTIFGGIVYLGIKIFPVAEFSDTTKISDKATVAKLDRIENTVSIYNGSSNSEVKVNDSLPQDQNLEIEEANDNFGKKLSRLLQLDESIEMSNKKLNSLMVTYDQNLGNDEIKQELSSALLENKEYRSNLLEKFKIERELRNLN